MSARRDLHERKVLIGETETARLALLTEDGEAAEFYAERKDKPLLAGNIYRAKVLNAGSNGMVFLSIGEDGRAVAAVKDRKPSAGDLLTVTVKRDFFGEKVPFATEGISFQTPYAMYGGAYTDRPYVYASGKLASETRRAVLKAAEDAGLTERVSFRTRAGTLGSEELKEAAAEVRKRIDELRAAERKCFEPRRLLKLTFEMRAEAHFNTLPEETEAADFGVPPYDAVLRRASERVTEVSGYGRITVEQTEAFVSVDVDAYDKTDRLLSENALAVAANFAAAVEIYRQIRLKNLSGTILVDAVSMKEEKDRQALLDAFRQAFAPDGKRSEVTGYTKSGVYEILRAREGIPVTEAIKEAKCPSI